MLTHAVGINVSQPRSLINGVFHDTIFYARYVRVGNIPICELHMTSFSHTFCVSDTLPKKPLQKFRKLKLRFLHYLSLLQLLLALSIPGLGYERNRKITELHKRVKEKQHEKIITRVRAIEECKDDSRCMFQAVRALQTRPM